MDLCHTQQGQRSAAAEESIYQPLSWGSRVELFRKEKKAVENVIAAAILCSVLAPAKYNNCDTKKERKKASSAVYHIHCTIHFFFLSQ